MNPKSENLLLVCQHAPTDNNKSNTWMMDNPLVGCQLQNFSQFWIAKEIMIKLLMSSLIIISLGKLGVVSQASTQQISLG
jgi:hypothetical protein